jgi:hypothetical protein
MFRSKLVFAFYCHSPWLSHCHKPARTSAEVEAHYEAILPNVYYSLVANQAARRAATRIVDNSTTTDYFEQQDEQILYYSAWRRADDALRLYNSHMLVYASELAYARHYERLVAQDAEDKRRTAERERQHAEWQAALKAQTERDNAEDAAKIGAALATLPAYLAPAVVARIRYCLKMGLMKGRWDRQPRATRRILKGLPLIETGV